MKIFKQKSITNLYIYGMFIMFLFVILFSSLVIYEEYNDFDTQAKQIRVEYIKEQKESILFDTNRVLEYIQNEYNSRESAICSTELKTQILNAIKYLYGRQDGTGYIFVYSFDGVKLADPIQEHSIGENLYNFKDSNGIQVIKELIEVSKKADGGFVNYQWLKPTSNLLSPKVSYAKSFMPWGWMIGTGVYLDEVEKLILLKKRALKKRLIKLVMEILSLSIILFGLGLVGVSVVHNIIKKEIVTFRRFFKRASRKHVSIDVNKIELVEFKKMVKYANKMVSEIHRRKNRLKELNLSLEQKVEEKTSDLQEKNKQLEKEKKFRVALIKAQDSFIKHSTHEINTPLAVIMTHIDMYKLKYGENRYLSKIEAGSKMIGNIYDDLSYMVKKERFVYAKSHIDFSDFLKSRIHFFKEIALGNWHKILFEIENGIEIYFSDIELQRIVDNNLSNAIKYAKKKSDISVSLKKDDEYIFLKFITYSKKIEDTQKIFEAFHREEKLKGGFGLGLEIVGSICLKEGVEIVVDSGDEVTVFEYRFRV